MIVKLTEIEMSAVSHLGNIRMITGFRYDWKTRNKGRRLWDNCIEAAAAEYAVAKALGIHFSPDNIAKADLSFQGVPIEVRTVTNADYGLRIEAKDNPSAIAVLTYGYCPEFNIVGWCVAVEAMTPERKMKGHENDYYLMKNYELRPFADLKPYLLNRTKKEIAV